LSKTDGPAGHIGKFRNAFGLPSGIGLRRPEESYVLETGSNPFSANPTFQVGAVLD